MRKVFIRYNPYKVETLVKIDGKDIKSTSVFSVGHKHLQEWVEELPSMLYEELNDREYELTFYGTTLDYEDVEAATESAYAKAHGMRFKLQHEDIRQMDVEREAAIKALFAEVQKGPFDELRSRDIAEAFTNASSREFPVNVIATMSSGKSTLINAMLSKKLMPAKQEACTATITKIHDTDSVCANGDQKIL